MNSEIKVHVVDYGRKNLYLRYVCPLTGKQVVKTSKTSNLDAAKKEAGKWEDQLREGRYKPRSKLTWEDFRERYEKEYLAGLAETSQAKNTGVLDSFELEFKIDKLAEITGATISKYQSILRDRGLAEFTIKGHLSVMRSALNWAKKNGMLGECPAIAMPKRAKASKVMKGRPISGEEFDRMVAAVAKVRPDEVAQWERLLRGLWWSGLRIGEAINLTWDRDDRLRVILAGDDSLLHIPAACQKSNDSQVCPVAPEFVEFLQKTAPDDRRGFVFKLPFRRKDTIVKTLCRIGEKAGVIVDRKETDDPEKPKIKYASAHDLRRSFGERWKHRVMPPVLQELMRHADIQTTMQFYTDRTAKTTGKLLWQQYRGSLLGNTHPEKERTAQDSNLQPSVP